MAWMNARPSKPARALLALLAAVAGCSAAPVVGASPSKVQRVVPAIAVGAAEAIRAENALPGYPGWRITHPGRVSAIEGFTDAASALPGAPVRLYVSTTASSYRVLAFRIGWYGGTLARLVWTSPVLAGFRQSAAVVKPHGMVVAPWQPSLILPTAGWPPGAYLLRLDAASGAQRYVPLVIRSPSVAGRVVIVQAVTSYQAYNGWGGYDLYNGLPDGSFADRARIVSFDRPYLSEDGAGSFFVEEQPLLTIAERLGLPLAYLTSVDIDLDPHALDGARAVLSEGHDEYWSPRMRAAFTRARNLGTNLAFFGANAIFRKIRLAPSRLGPDRTEINYKIPAEDPLYGVDNALVTGSWPSWPDPMPESAVIGQSYGCLSRRTAMVVTNQRGWVWAGTGLRPGTSLPGLVGSEFDTLDLSSPTPRPIEYFARSPENCRGVPLDSYVTYYVARSDAGVFDSGTESWVCALPTATCLGQRFSPIVQQAIATATSNVLQAFAVGPAGLAHPARDFLTGRVYP